MTTQSQTKARERLRILMTAIVVLAIVFPFVFILEHKGGVVSDQEVLRIVEGAGYTQVMVGENTTTFLLNRCGSGDTHSTTFTATDHRGGRVSGRICAGWSTGKTIRLD